MLFDIFEGMLMMCATCSIGVAIMIYLEIPNPISQYLGLLTTAEKAEINSRVEKISNDVADLQLDTKTAQVTADVARDEVKEAKAKFDVALTQHGKEIKATRVQANKQSSQIKSNRAEIEYSRKDIEQCKLDITVVQAEAAGNKDLIHEAVGDLRTDMIAELRKGKEEAAEQRAVDEARRAANERAVHKRMDELAIVASRAADGALLQQELDKIRAGTDEQLEEMRADLGSLEKTVFRRGSKVSTAASSRTESKD